MAINLRKFFPPKEEFPVHQASSEETKRVKKLMHEFLSSATKFAQEPDSTVVQVLNALAAASAFIVEGTLDERMPHFYHQAFDYQLSVWREQKKKEKL